MYGKIKIPDAGTKGYGKQEKQKKNSNISEKCLEESSQKRIKL